MLQITICAFGAIYGTVWEKREMVSTNVYLDITVSYEKPWRNWLSLTF